MTRRLTISGSRSEMGLLAETQEPQTPPPVWTPAKNDFWRKPSRWQICMPRLRFIAKAILCFAGLIVILRVLNAKPPPPDPVPEPPPPAPEEKKAPPPTEEEMTEQSLKAAKLEKWAWKDFPYHDGLTRGTSHFETCKPSDSNCVNKPPQMIRYDGYKHFQESVEDIVQCMGPRGLLINESDADAIWAYPKIAKGAANPTLGSYEAAGLDGSVSFDRFGRFQAYGLDQFDSVDIEELKQASDVEWDAVQWGDLQEACVESNRQRFKPMRERPNSPIQYSNTRHKHENIQKPPPTTLDAAYVSKTKRTAILIRVWTGATWSADAVMNIRAMIAEAGLASGGKYQVFILLHVKDDKVPLFTGEGQPEATIKKNIPPEFHSITEVWNHAQIRGLYSNLADHAFVGRSPWMIIQWFARNHPEFDFFYQWEFDVRYTGHYLDFFEGISEFGRQQPRKGIWERAGRVYIPSVHGPYHSEFREKTKAEDPHHVWGPVSVEGVKPRGPKAPHSEEEDNYEWGVGEDADWIGLLPSFNVTGTNWYFRDYIWGYAQGKSTPRRATLIAQGRVSRRLLEIMNYENAENGHHIDAEMFPQTMCLHHGLKSTTFPHPIYADRDWTSEVLQKTFNGGPFGQAGGFWNSTFSKFNEFAWTNMTWYYSSAQAMPIYQRLLGITAHETGGPEWEDAFGRTVVRPMLLHPVKGAKSWKWTSDGWQQTPAGE